jgi:ubiquinone biosynthesis UbiH/UbiF/VisC/COQ6 family hydroxylase
VRLALGDGREIEGTLLIGADAAASPTRRLLGIETAGHAYHQDALVAHVSSARPHAGTARQRFLPGGPLAFLPLPDGRCSIVWSVARAEAARLLQLDAASFGHELTTASGHCLGDCVLTTPIAAFPLQLQYATDYVRGRGVLVGDAAHAVHPLAGQGLNLGLMDCAALAQVLAEAAECGAGRSDRRVLRRYERWRRAENLMAVAALDGLERLFSSDQPAVLQLRMAGLGAVARLPFVKRDFAARALGLRGDVPRFLTVEA